MFDLIMQSYFNDFHFKHIHRKFTSFQGSKVIGIFRKFPEVTGNKLKFTGNSRKLPDVVIQFVH